MINTRYLNLKKVEKKLKIETWGEVITCNDVNQAANILSINLKT